MFVCSKSGHHEFWPLVKLRPSPQSSTWHTVGEEEIALTRMAWMGEGE
jgi:hypothetical protein